MINNNYWLCYFYKKYPCWHLTVPLKYWICYFIRKTVSIYILVNYIFIFYFTEHPFKFQAERWMYLLILQWFVVFCVCVCVVDILDKQSKITLIFNILISFSAHPTFWSFKNKFKNLKYLTKYFKREWCSC